LLNFLRMDKQALAQKINTLNGLLPHEKAALIQLLNTKRYGLVWENKPEQVETDLHTKLPILKELPHKQVIAQHATPPHSSQTSLDFDIHPTPQKHTIPNHTLIEGDNLHALTVLNYTHLYKIDVIYIDPPYNTGREDEFRYNDKWILKDDPFRHSSWLSFMVKRLRLAKNLLNDNGVMIIHIDENEFDALNLLLETEIFTEDSFLGAIVWNKQNPKGDAKGVASMHEYILVYAKNKSEFTSLENSLLRPKPNAEKILNKAKKLFTKIGKVEIPEEVKEVIKPFNFSGEILKDFEVQYNLDLVNKEFQSWINRQDFSGGEKAYKFIDENGIVYRGVSMAWPNKEQAPNDYLIPLIHPKTGKPCPIPGRGWRNPSSTMKVLLEKNLILFGDDETKQPERKYLLEENMFENTPSIFNNGVSDDTFFKDLGIDFAYPKPVEVAKYFLKNIHPNPNIVLDFFAGSGTTLHAVMALNAEDGGSRQCILVTNNENNICEEVTYQRNKRVIEGYTNAKGQAVAGLSGNALRYYQTGYVDSEKTLQNKRDLVRLATEMLCLKEGLYAEDKTTIDHADIRLFREGNRAFMIIYQEEAIDDAIGILQAIDIGGVIKVYVFADGHYPYTDDFEEVLSKIELCALPDAIYKAYQRLLP
jgi:adenine-specific DNA-methyltransferase